MLEKTRRLHEAIRAGGFIEDIAEQFRIQPQAVRFHLRKLGLTLDTRYKERSRHLRKVITEGYAADRPIAEIAAELGIGRNNVSVLANKLGLSSHTDKYRHRRGYAVPPELVPRYRELRKFGLTFKECGYVLKLIDRPDPPHGGANAAR